MTRATTNPWLLGLGSTSASAVPGLCDAAVEQYRAQRRSSRRFEIALILGGAAVSLTSFTLSEAGYPKVAGAITIAGIVVGAVVAAARLSSED